MPGGGDEAEEQRRVDEWVDIVKYMYNTDDATMLIARIQDTARLSWEAGSKASGKFNGHFDSKVNGSGGGKPPPGSMRTLAAEPVAAMVAAKSNK